jgi:hypothetical protein
MGDETSGTTYGDERVSSANGPARNPARPGTLGRIRGRLAPEPTGTIPEESAYEVGSGARIQTGEQVAGRAKPRERRADAGETATVAEANSAAKSTLAPLRMASRFASTVLGINAEMTAEERQDIAEPLARIYQRNGRVAAYVNRYTDPAMLLLGIGSYLARIWLAYQQTQLVKAQTALVNARNAQPQRQAAPVPIRQEPAPDRGVPARPEGPSFDELDGIFSMGRS